MNTLIKRRNFWESRYSDDDIQVLLDEGDRCVVACRDSPHSYTIIHYFLLNDMWSTYKICSTASPFVAFQSLTDMLATPSPPVAS